MPYAFAEHVSGGAWKAMPHLRYIGKKILDAISNGNGRLIINMPVRMGKSFFISYWLPIWYLDNYPNKRVILAAYGAELATEWGRRVRNEFAVNPMLSTKLREDSHAAGRWHTPEGGGMMTAGVGGAISGFGGDLILADDLIKNWQEAHSFQSKNMLWEWWKSTFFTRKEPGATVILAMTRWSDDDICARLIADQPEEWKVVRLPALAEDNDPLGRVPGAPLCPERYSLEAMQNDRRDVGAAVWSALYQQNPESYSSGRLYGQFSAENIEPEIKLRSDLPLCLAIDWNIDPGMNAVIGQYDNIQDMFYVINNIHEPRMDVRGLVDALQKWLNQPAFRWHPGGIFPWPDLHIFGDATGNNQWAGTSESCYDILKQKLNQLGLKYRVRVPNKNGPVREGIDTVNEALRDIDGKIHVKIHPRNNYLIEDFKKLKPDQHGLIDKREHALSHSSDSFRYWCTYLRPLWRYSKKDKIGGRLG